MESKGAAKSQTETHVMTSPDLPPVPKDAAPGQPTSELSGAVVSGETCDLFLESLFLGERLAGLGTNWWSQVITWVIFVSANLQKLGFGDWLVDGIPEFDFFS